MKYTEILSMKPEQIRIELGKLKGITDIRYTKDGGWYGFLTECNIFPFYFPDYLSEISASWTLIEEMAKKCSVTIIKKYVSWSVGFYSKYTSLYVEIEDTDIKTAICRAYLVWQLDTES